MASTKRAKRKLSDLTYEETNDIVSLLKNLLGDLDEDDADGLSVIESVKNVIRKLEKTEHLPFSDVSVASLADAHINVLPMKWTPTGRDDARAYGEQTTPGTVTLEDTKKRLANILRFVSTENEAGRRLIITELLLHVAWNLDTEKSGVAIAPEFRVSNKVLESNTRSYGGTVDYLVAIAPPRVRDVVVESAQLAFLSKDINATVSCNIYEAKPGGTVLLTALPQAAIAVAIRAQELGHQTFRGCITTGHEWLFFIYNRHQNGHGGAVSRLPSLRLGDDLENLALILGLLREWIEHGHSGACGFCEYWS
ncbi:hypothetical protein LshimejAT787_0505420 [Lyophyllum shimeji]|uniref:Uncharacterized protein n=1 Tax=Lyophyllum shimeji TaxID=47721 RepID=A0A9P3PLS6_LYOSH|nr:hypothetical protein LshimejAT787_0505420 [Lyophyllum shimeji]